MLLLEAGMMGSFLSLDLFMFFVFFEIVLVPMYFLIGGWGYGNRVYAATKFFLFTMFGSAFMFVGILATVLLGRRYGVGEITFNLVTLAEQASFPTATGRWLFFAFAIAFAVKVPVIPFHTWLPDAHTQAPTAGSVILAGVMLKLGTYGLLRFGLYLFPEAAQWARPLLLTLAVIGITYGAIVATMQRDLKRLVAYSSIAHLGFIVLGMFALTSQAVTGGVLQMINHGVSTGALFVLVGWIYERRHTREIADLRGIQQVAPIFAAGFTVVMLSSIAVPGLNGFVGEYLVLVGSFQSARWWTVVAAAGVILAALYLLWAYQRVFHGEVDDDNRSFAELTGKEGLALLVFIGIIVFTGVYPKPMIDRVEPSVVALIDHVEERTGEDYSDPEVVVVAPPRPRMSVRSPAAAEASCSARSSLADVPFVGPEVQWFALSPLLVLVAAAILLLLAGALTPTWPRGLYAGVTAAAAIAAGVLAVIQWDDISDSSTSTLVGGAIAFDTFAMFVTIVICAAVVGVALVAGDQLHRDGGDGPEVYALVLVAAAGAVVMGAANDLIVLFLGLETMSLAFYVLAASNRRRTKSQESGMKYFILGGFSSAFFLYGIALVYGSTGSTNLSRDRHGVRQHDPGRPQRRAAARRHRPAPRRARLQGRRRPVPRVDARRLRGGADAGHRADGVGRQGGGVRRDAARARSPASATTATTGDRSSGSSPWRR